MENHKLPQLSPIWQGFDEAICITLSSRPERRQRAETFFKKLGIPVRFFVAKPHPLGGRYGCLHSHVNVAWWLRDKQVTRAVVFEDDVITTDLYDESHISHALKWMTENKNWDLFYLGAIPVDHFAAGIAGAYGGHGGNKIDVFTGDTSMFLGGVDKPDPHVIQFHPVGAHAFVYSKRGIERVLNGLELGSDPSDPYFVKCVKGQVDCETYFYKNPLHFDMYVNTHRFDSFVYVPILFEQDWCLSSDNIPAFWAEKMGRMLYCINGKISKGNLIHSLWAWRGWEWFTYLAMFVTIIIILIYPTRLRFEKV